MLPGRPNFEAATALTTSTAIVRAIPARRFGFPSKLPVMSQPSALEGKDAAFPQDWLKLLRLVGTYVRDVGGSRLCSLRRALETRALWAVEDAAREMPNLSLQDGLQLVHLYAERGSPSTRRRRCAGSSAIWQKANRGCGTLRRSRRVSPSATLQATIRASAVRNRTLRLQRHDRSQARLDERSDRPRWKAMPPRRRRS